MWSIKPGMFAAAMMVGLMGWAAFAAVLWGVFQAI